MGYNIKLKAPINKLRRPLSKAQVLSRLKRYIKAKDRYCPIRELCKIPRVSSSVINKHNISIVNLNKELGYKQPHNKVELVIEEYLTNLLPNSLIETQKTFKDLVGESGRPLRYDLCIDNSLLIELDDPTHWDHTSRWASPKRSDYDSKKDRFAVSKQIPLLRVRFTGMSDVGAIKDSILIYIQTYGYLNGNNFIEGLNQQPD
jgi:hypothetical protein